MTTEQRVDAAKVEEFAGRAISDFSGMMTVALCHLGDRLGLFKELGGGGPATAAELAGRAGIEERYAAEWLRGLAAPGYLDYDPATGRYGLSPEHALVLAVEGSPAFLGGGLPDVRRHAGAARAREAGVHGWRRSRPAGVPARVVGGPGAVHGRLVRELPAAGVDPVDAGRPGEAAGRL